MATGEMKTVFYGVFTIPKQIRRPNSGNMNTYREELISAIIGRKELAKR